MEKLFNLEAGFTKEDDQLPKRLTTILKRVRRRVSFGVPEMLPETTNCEGGIRKNSKPEKLKSLGL